MTPKNGRKLTYLGKMDRLYIPGQNHIFRKLSRMSSGDCPRLQGLKYGDIIRKNGPTTDRQVTPNIDFFLLLGHRGVAARAPATWLCQAWISMNSYGFHMNSYGFCIGLSLGLGLGSNNIYSFSMNSSGVHMNSYGFLWIPIVVLWIPIVFIWIPEVFVQV